MLRYKWYKIYTNEICPNKNTMGLPAIFSRIASRRHISSVRDSHYLDTEQLVSVKRAESENITHKKWQMSKPNTSIVDQNFNKWRLDHVNDPLELDLEYPKTFW